MRHVEEREAEFRDGCLIERPAPDTLHAMANAFLIGRFFAGAFHPLLTLR